jgi:hypothetical protein
VHASGAVLYDAPVVLTDAARAGNDAYSAALLELEGDHALTVWLPIGEGADDSLIVFEPGNGEPARLAPGDSVESAGLAISYLSMATVPAAVVEDLPLPESAGQGSTGEAYLQLSNVVYGTDRTSEGLESISPAARGPVTLTAIGLDQRAVQLEPGQSTTIDGLEYSFEGQREFSGITVRRDRSDYLVWAGAAMIVAGLMITFWVPRRRLWARISSARASLAGQAPGHASYSREMRKLLEAASAPAERAARRGERQLAADGNEHTQEKD